MNKIFSEIEDKFPGFRSIDRWNCGQFGYRSVVDFCAEDEFDFGVHTIYDGSFPVDIHLNMKRGLPLIVALNGALPLRGVDFKLPVFSGFGVIPSAKASVVRISDPALYASKELKLGWYAGVSGLNFQDVIFRVISKLVLTYSPERLIFFGGSGGGFASLNFSQMFSDSVAVVWNPQTDILKFDKLHVVEYASNAFGIEDFDGCQKELPSVINSSLFGLYDKYAQNNYVLLMQNRGDWHVRWHCLPFLKAMGFEFEDDLVSRQLSQRFYLHFGDWGEGHAPPTREFQTKLMDALLDTSVSVKDFFSGVAVRSAIAWAESV